jgi:cbb3-type cytochrome oxidase maturation protein
LSILFLLIPLGLLLLGLAVAAFFWATKSGQFDDLESPAWSVVMDDDRAPDSVNRRNKDDPADRNP